MAEQAKAPAQPPAPGGAPAGDKKKKALGKPSALKRDQQNERKKLRNRSHRSSVLTAVRDLEKAISNKDAPAAVKVNLSAIYKLMDKGVKKGIYTPQKAARTKSRLAARTSK